MEKGSTKRIKIFEFRESKFQFPKQAELIQNWIRTYHKDKVVVYFDECSERFKNIPHLAILKRDDLNTYLEGSEATNCLVLFDTLEEARDFGYTLASSEYLIFMDGEIYNG